MKNIWPNYLSDRPSPASQNFDFGHWTGSPHSPKPDPAKVVTIKGTSDVNSQLKQTGVDKLHSKGYKGKGVKIGIVDTGVDYRHPALGGGFGKGFKIAGGRDLVGDAYTGENTPVPDKDPLVDCLSGGHGTHVAGIIGAQDPKNVGYGIVGVAPEAQLYMYRVFGCDGGVADEIIIDAFIAAVEDGVDVISMSIGRIQAWEAASPYADIFASIKAAGVGMVVAAGNSGTGGPYLASWPALDPSIISVGSVDNTHFNTLYHAKTTGSDTIEYAALVPTSSSGSYHIFMPETDVDCDQQMWTDTLNWPNPDKIIALISINGYCRDALPYFTNQTHISNIWYYMDDAEDYNLPPGGTLPFDMAVVKVSAAQKIVDGIEKYGKDKYVLTFKDQSVYNAVQPTSNTVSSYSSWGPTVEMSLTPQLSGPGGNILSTWPTTDGVGYALISGTSMATPHVAGSYALIKQAFPHLGPDEILARLQNTAVPLKEYLAPNMLTSTTQQGSGLINAYAALYADTKVTPMELNLADSSKTVVRKLTIKNTSKKTKKYTIDSTGSAYVSAAPGVHDRDHMYSWYANNEATYASVSFSSRKVTIKAGSSATVTVSITPPKKIDAATMPLYGGFVEVTDEAGSQYTVPYAGVPYARSSLPVLDFGSLWQVDQKPLPGPGIPNTPAVLCPYWNSRDNDLMEFFFPAPIPTDPDEDQDDDNDPLFSFAISQPSPYVRIDAVHPNLRFHADEYGYDTTEILPTNNPDKYIKPVEKFLGVESYGLIYAYVGGYDKPASPLGGLYTGYGALGTPWYWAETAAPNGTLIQLPNADYRVLVRALKWGHEWEDKNGYESWLSPVVRVNISNSTGRTNPYDKYN